MRKEIKEVRVALHKYQQYLEQLKNNDSDNIYLTTAYLSVVSARSKLRWANHMLGEPIVDFRYEDLHSQVFVSTLPNSYKEKLEYIVRELETLLLTLDNKLFKDWKYYSLGIGSNELMYNRLPENIQNSLLSSIAALREEGGRL